MPCHARGGFPLPTVPSPQSPPLPALLFPKFNPSPHTTDLSPPCDLLRVAVIGSGRGHEDHGGSEAAEQPQPHGAARGHGCPAQAVPVPPGAPRPGPWPLMSVAGAAPGLPAAVDRSELSPRYAGESKGPQWGRRDGQRHHVWTRDGAEPPLLFHRLGWDGGNISPKRVSWASSSSSTHLFIPSATPGHQRHGQGAAPGAGGALSSPKSCSALAGAGDADATGRIKSSTSNGS